jgi:acyl-CoA reductase-like NAD-dependent aldehyde dehydrogenase
VAAGRWRNPALTDAARAKLSRPRRHTGALHNALEKLKRGLRVADLTAEQQDAHRAYRRQQRAELWARMTEEQRARLRAKWRADVRRRRVTN